MDNNEICRQIKQNIELLINNKKFDEAKSLIDEYKKMVPDDIEIYSMEGVMLISEGKFDEAEKILVNGKLIDDNNFDINYNLGFTYEQKKDFKQALWYYKVALNNCNDENVINDINKFIGNIQSKYNISTIENKKKIVFFVKRGMDSFLGDIITGLSGEYETKKTIVTDYHQIDEGMQWADICWFEWCDELVIYGSKLPIAKEKKIVCRIHGYEVYTDLIRQPNWNNVDDLIIVAPHIRKIFEENTKNINFEGLRIHTIFCGINVNRYPLNIKKKGFNLGYLGYINFKKNIPLTLDIFKKLYDVDKRYKLYIAGQFQDARTLSYLKYFIKEYKLEKNIVFDGWQNEKQKVKWFKKIDYMIISSIDEGLCFAAAEGMVSGIKPILHNCEGLKDHYDKKYIFNNVDEAVSMILSNDYDSIEYRKFIENNYSLKNQLAEIKSLLNSSPKKKSEENLTLEYMVNMFNSFIPYSSEYIDKFDFENCQVRIGKREIISQDFDLIEFILKNKFDKQIVFTDILYDKSTNKIIFHDYILKSKFKDEIFQIVRNILNLKGKFFNNIQGYVFDEQIAEDIRKNQLAYSWERGIPATQFMPAIGWLRVIERYRFAVNFIKLSDVILEAACGFGYGAAYFHDKCKNIYALDLAQENIKFNKCSYDFDNVMWTNGDVTKLPYENNKFDVYTSFETLEHLPLNVIEDYFKEAIRVLKHDGIMLISTPNREMRKNVHNPFHIKEYAYNEFDEMLHKYFSKVQYYSVVNYKVEDGMKRNAINMIAVCSNVSLI